MCRRSVEACCEVSSRAQWPLWKAMKGIKAHGRIGWCRIGNDSHYYGLVSGEKPWRQTLWVAYAKRRDWQHERKEVWWCLFELRSRGQQWVLFSRVSSVDCSSERFGSGNAQNIYVRCVLQARRLGCRLCCVLFRKNQLGIMRLKREV